MLMLSLVLLEKACGGNQGQPLCMVGLESLERGYGQCKWLGWGWISEEWQGKVSGVTQVNREGQIWCLPTLGQPSRRRSQQKK